MSGGHLRGVGLAVICLAAAVDPVGGAEPGASAAERKLRELERMTCRDGTAVPQSLLDDVSSAVPEYLWLTQLKKLGDRLLVHGASTTDAAIDAFAARLDASPLVGEVRVVARGDSLQRRESATPGIPFAVEATVAPPPIPASGWALDLPPPPTDPTEIRRMEARLAAKLATLDRVIPAEGELPELQEQVERLAGLVDIDVVLAQPEPLERGEFFGAYRCTYTLHASYHNLASFHDRLHKLSRLIVVTSLDVAQLSPGEARRQGDTVSARLSICTVVRLQTKQRPASQSPHR